MTPDQLLIERPPRREVLPIAQCSTLRSLLRETVVLVMILVTAPLWLLAIIEARLSASDELFATCSQWLSLVPGKLGIFLRRAFYRCTLDQFSTDCGIGFGTTVAHRRVRIGRGVYIGIRCTLGCVTIDDHTTIGSNVDILSGRRQHGFDERDVPVQLQAGVYSQVHIGRNCWIGNGSVIMADVGDECVIGAGSVVVAPIPAGCVAVGNPCRLKKQRLEPAEAHDWEAGIP
jgi:virginiamycin A acetyltransferase